MCGILQRECRALINEINAEAGLRDESKLRWFDWLNWKRLSAQQACCSPQGWQLLWAHSLLAMLLMIILQDVESLNIPLSFVIAMRRTSEISFLNFDASFLDFRAVQISYQRLMSSRQMNFKLISHELREMRADSKMFLTWINLRNFYRAGKVCRDLNDKKQFSSESFKVHLSDELNTQNISDLIPSLHWNQPDKAWMTSKSLFFRPATGSFGSTLGSTLMSQTHDITSKPSLFAF